jgi:hypothetical protein
MALSLGGMRWVGRAEHAMIFINRLGDQFGDETRMLIGWIGWIRAVVVVAVFPCFGFSVKWVTFLTRHQPGRFQPSWKS